MARANRKKATKAKRIRTPEELATIRAGMVGMPDAQIQQGDIEEVDVQMRPNERVTMLRTVRKLTRVELLKRNGTLTGDEAIACEWFADVHALAWDTVGVTGNYEGAGGGGFSSSDLLARYRAQAEAREDYWFARALIASQDIELFELVICKNHTLGDTAEAMFEHLRRSQAIHRTTHQLKRAANMLHAGIAHRLPAS